MKLEETKYPPDHPDPVVGWSGLPCIPAGPLRAGSAAPVALGSAGPIWQSASRIWGGSQSGSERPAVSLGLIQGGSRSPWLSLHKFRGGVGMAFDGLSPGGEAICPETRLFEPPRSPYSSTSLPARRCRHPKTGKTPQEGPGYWRDGQTPSLLTLLGTLDTVRVGFCPVTCGPLQCSHRPTNCTITIP
jgi:hypothetical protein